MRAWPVLVGAVALWSCVGTVRGGPVFARTAAETNAGLQGAIFAGVGDTVGDVGVVVSGHAGRGLTAERWFGSLLGGLGGRISWRTTDAFRVGGWVELLAGRTFASDGGPLVQIRLGPVLSSALARRSVRLEVMAGLEWPAAGAVRFSGGVALTGGLSEFDDVIGRVLRFH